MCTISEIRNRPPLGQCRRHHHPTLSSSGQIRVQSLRDYSQGQRTRARQAKRRGVDETTLNRIADRPEQVLAVRRGREVRQSRIQSPEGTGYLVRVFVDIAEDQETVVTVYKTSKIAKYWRKS